MRPELLKKARVGENFRPSVFVKFGEFRQKLIADFNNSHGQSCNIRHYAVKGIFWGLFGDLKTTWPRKISETPRRRAADSNSVISLGVSRSGNNLLRRSLSVVRCL